MPDSGVTPLLQLLILKGLSGLIWQDNFREAEQPENLSGPYDPSPITAVKTFSSC